MKFSRKNKSFFLLFTGLALLAVAWLSGNSDTSTQFHQRQASSFARNFAERELEANELLDKFITNCAHVSNDSLFIRCTNQSQSANSPGYFVFEGEKLVFWSHNRYPINSETLSNGTVPSPLRLDNGWYVSSSISRETRTFLVLLPVKFEFPHQNKYLTDHFVPPFSLNQSTRLTYDLNEADEKITLGSGRLSFGLIFSGEETLGAPDVGIIGLFFAGLFLFFAGFYILTWSPARRGRDWVHFLSLSALVVLVRGLMITFEFPGSLYDTELFGPGLYATTKFFPSLGDLILNAIAILVLSAVMPVQSWNRLQFLWSLLLWLIVMGVTIWTGWLGAGLILHSSVVFLVNNIFTLSTHSIVGLIALILLFSGPVILAIRLILDQSVALKIRFFTWLIAAAGVLIYMLFPGGPGAAELVWPLVLTGFLLASKYFNEKKFGFGTALIVLILFSTYSALITNHYAVKKDRKTMLLVAERLASENDPVAEYLFIDLAERIEADTTLAIKASAPWEQETETRQYLRNRYFYGYWDKYEIRTTLCVAGDSLVINPGNYKRDCLAFFDSLVKHTAVPVGGSPLYYLEGVKGRVSYLSKIRLVHDSIPVFLFLELHSKFIPEGSGYPELLLDEDETRNNPDRLNYSYARYHHGELVLSGGPNSFSATIPTGSFRDTVISFVEASGQETLVYRASDEEVIMLNRRLHTLFDDVTTFSYFFTIFSLLALAYFFTRQVREGISNWLYRFRTRIQLLFIGTVILSLLLFGAGTVIYIEKQYRTKNDNIVSEKLRSVTIELEQKLGQEAALTPQMEELLTFYLVKFSNVFFTDINLYSKNGELLASSRPEIFNKGLISGKMDATAFRNLNYQGITDYIHEERIGSMSYLSAYVPFRNTEGEVLAYLNLPYFSKQNELEKEISVFLVALINIYVLLLIISVTIAVFISNYVTRPVQLIREKMRQVQLGSLNEHIHWKSRDELGSLIREYNRMIEELAESAERLARSERESAWREMAKQVAHEIKNPLTPMKLTIQHLQKAWNDNSPEFARKLEKTTATLITQIDTLSAIATEFSNFAKMPKPMPEAVDLINLLSDVAALHTDHPGIKMNFVRKVDEAYCYAGRDHLLRIFNNLVKNAIQAIPEDQEGLVEIILEKDNSWFEVKIKDNGTGIPVDIRERIFEPSFTTKTSGMGLGLAMVKNMVEMSGGDVWFETEEDNGSCFHVRVPVYEMKS